MQSNRNNTDTEGGGGGRWGKQSKVAHRPYIILLHNSLDAKIV